MRILYKPYQCFARPNGCFTLTKNPTPKGHSWWLVSSYGPWRGSPFQHCCCCNPPSLPGLAAGLWGLHPPSHYRVTPCHTYVSCSFMTSFTATYNHIWYSIPTPSSTQCFHIRSCYVWFMPFIHSCIPSFIPCLHFKPYLICPHPFIHNYAYLYILAYSIL